VGELEKFNGFRHGSRSEPLNLIGLARFADLRRVQRRNQTRVPALHGPAVIAARPPQ